MFYIAFVNFFSNAFKQSLYLLSWNPNPWNGECSQEIKSHLSLGRKVMTNLDSVLKSRDITLPTKIYVVKAMVFPVVIYERTSSTIKKAECQRTDAFELWCWRILDSPLDSKETKPVNPPKNQP